MLELSIQLPLSSLIEACVYYTKLLSKFMSSNTLRLLFLWRGSHYNTDSPLLTPELGPNTLLLWLYYIHMLSMIWMVWMLILRALCMSRIWCAGGEAREDRLHVCYCLRVIQHVTWYVHTLLACYLKIFLRELHASVKFKLSCTVHVVV